MELPEIRLTNTLTKKKELFIPCEAGHVKIYSCGPTVYDFAHIGNFRSFMMSDLLFRVFRYAGYEVKKVQNITDVGHLTNDDLADAVGDDKIAKKAKAEHKDPFEIARNFEDFFIEDEQKLRILPPNAGRPRATDFIDEQIEICQELIDKGFAYTVNGSVYFRTKKFKAYGKLSGNKLQDLNVGVRITINPEKEDPLDFALWKKADVSHFMQWDSPWGKGFPGWHIECSAMSRKLLGETFDIHTGGEDNIFPHHECEIAQNQCGFEGRINYWLHGKHLLVDGKKMSKSKGNFYTVRDIFKKGYSGVEIRYLFLSSHYRKTLNFTFDGLDMARQSIARITEARRLFQAKASTELASPTADEEKTFALLRQKYRAALFDDLGVSEALSAVFEVISLGHKVPTLSAKGLDFLIQDVDPIFDIFPEEEAIDGALKVAVEAKIKARNQARIDKDWAEADKIRDALLSEGIRLIDEGDETRWEKI